MIQQVQNSCQFHGLPGDDANKHLDKFLHVTQSIKVNGVTDDALGLYLFPHSLTHHATAWFDRLLRNSINTFEQMAKMFLALKAEMAKINKNLMRVLLVNQQVKAVTPNCETFGGPYSSMIVQPPLAKPKTYMLRGPVKIPQTQVVTTNEFTNFKKENDGILKNMQTNMTSLTNSNLELKNMFGQFMKMNTASSLGSRTLPGNTITNPKEDPKGITTRSGTTYQGPTIPTTFSSLPPVVERKTEATKDTVHLTNNGSIEDVQPLVVPTEYPILNSKPFVAPIIEPVASPVSASKPKQRPSISFPSRLHDQMLRDKANDQREKFFQIFKDLNFNISFVDAFILMPKFGPSIKSLLTNKDKLYELARTPLNEHCSVVLLKKFPKKLGDPGKFLIPCDFPGMPECLALADLDASINVMPLSMWNKFSLPDLSPTCMTLELTDRLISCPVGVAEDVFVKVGTFHFLADFVVVDFDADPRVPLILGRSFLKTERALIDVFQGELTLRVSKEAITFNLEYSQEVLGFSDVITSGNPTPYYDPIVSTTSPTLTPFKNSDFLLEKVDAFLALKDDPTSPKVDQSYGTDPEFCTHKILMDEDFEPAVQHQRSVNPKIHGVITNEVLKLLDAGLIYPISDSPWRYMMAIFHDMIEKTMEVFMDHFSVFEGIVLGHKISKNGIEVDKAKVDVIAKLPHPTTVKGIHRFLGHAGFYRRFSQDFSKIARPMTRLFENDTLFLFSKECVEAFQTLNRKFTKAPILIAPDWDMPFELMCDASDFAIGAVLGQHQEKHFRPIHYASKTMIEAELNYTTMKKEMLAVVNAFKKFRPYLIMNKSIVYTDHSALKYLFAKKDSKARLLCWVLLFQEFTFKVIDTKGVENLATDHLS
uniref:RNA-directed DNA polymerase n=1 Tax=Tanacetum cinerariifolium TaxID=118510 RepID=A0A6L2LU23_TANCI|nr:reverse transcriptase domain-containing protein [Tanacetum cinerariifolium]